MQVPDGFLPGIEKGDVALGYIAGTINLKGGTFDLSEIGQPINSGTRELFFLGAAEQLNLQGFLEPSGFSKDSLLEMSAIRGVSIAPSSNLFIDDQNSVFFSLDSFGGDIDLTDVSIDNLSGGIDIMSRKGNITSSSSFIAAGFGDDSYPVLFGDATGDTGGGDTFPVQSFTSVYLDAQNITSNNDDIQASEVHIDARNLVEVDASFISGDFIDISANRIDSENTDFNANDLFMQAAERLNLKSSDLTELSSVNLGARTLVLADVQFSSGSSVSLGSANGQLAASPNMGKAAVPNYVNFVNNVKVDGLPAQDFVSTTQGGTGIKPTSIDIYSID